MTVSAEEPTSTTGQEAAEERLVGILNDAALALMLSVAHRTGLLAVLAAEGPVSGPDLARAAGLSERYVREALGALTVGRIVDLDPTGAAYHLGPEYAALLTDPSVGGGEVNFGTFMQYVAVLGSVEDDVVACFRDGGGVPYERFPRFHEVMAEESAQTVAAALDDVVLPLVTGLTGRLEAGIDVLDVGCGRGRTLLRLAESYPRSRFTGLDLSAEAIAHASAAATDAGLGHLTYRCADAGDLAEIWPEAGFDLVTTFDAVHDQAHPRQVARGIRDVLRPDGVYLAQDINMSGSHAGDLDHPLGPFLYTISCLHCMTVSLAAGGEGLGAAWGRPAAEALFAEAGFGSVETHVLPHDVQNAWYVCRP